MGRRRVELESEGRNAGMLGVLSIMLLLVPALLLMTYIDRHAAITVVPPRYGGDDPGPHVISCGRTELEVAIATDGFWTRATGRGWERAGAPAAGYDLDALALAARAYHRDYPHARAVWFSADPNVEYATLIAAMDTVRGPECDLAEAMVGQEVPAECMLWQPLIRARLPDDSIPKFRGGQTWPPWGKRFVTPERAARPR